MRYRQRYVDLIVNPQVRSIYKRTKLTNSMRSFLNEKGYMVETPILQPFMVVLLHVRSRHITIHLTYAFCELQMKLYLKDLSLAALRVYEFAKISVNEGMMPLSQSRIYSGRIVLLLAKIMNR